MAYRSRMPETETARSSHSPGLKLLLELGPLVVFFAANLRPEWFRPLIAPFAPASLMADKNSGIFIATAVFMVAMLISLVATRWLLKRLPVMPLISGVFVLIFGGLTLWLHDDTFIKMKPTIVNSIFAVALLGALALGKSLLPIVLDSVFDLDDQGWKKLTFRWGLFFVVLAVLNEVIWRNFSNEFWAGFKVWGVMPLTMLFAVFQTPLIMKHDRSGVFSEKAKQDKA
jgi:intracellular septation protein